MFLRLDRNSTFRRNLMLNLLQALLGAVLVLTLFLSMYSRFLGQEMHQRKHLLNTELEHIGDELENGYTDEEMKMIRDFVDQYPTPEGECYELERTSPRYKGIILTDRNNVEN